MKRINSHEKLINKLAQIHIKEEPYWLCKKCGKKYSNPLVMCFCDEKEGFQGYLRK